MSLTLDNPIGCPAGTTTANLNRSIKATEIMLVAASATAGTMVIADLNGNIQFPGLQVPATAGAVASIVFNTPLILPGGQNATISNWVVTVTGTGVTGWIRHR